MPIQARSADGIIHQFPDGTDMGVVDRVMKQYADQARPQAASDASHPFDASAGKPTLIPPEQKDPELGIRFGGSTAIASEPAPGPNYEEAQQRIKDLANQGAAPESPEIKAALRDRGLALNRLATGGLGLAGGGRVGMRGAAEAVSPIFKKAGQIAASATGKAAEEAATGLKAEATTAVSEAIKEAQAPIAKAEALTKAAAEKSPEAKVIGVKETPPDAGQALGQARQRAQSAAKASAKAESELAAAQRQMAIADKYAGSNKSSSAVRSARRNLTLAQRAVDTAASERETAQTALKEAQDAAKEAREAQNRVVTSERQIQTQARSAKELVRRYEKIRADINAPNSSPAQIITNTRNLASMLQKSGRLTEQQYQEFKGQINEVARKQESADKMKRRLELLIKSLEVTVPLGLGAGAIYGIRRGLVAP
jgi:hypothetical protein